MTQVQNLSNGGVINVEIDWDDARKLAHEGIQKNHLSHSLIQRIPMDSKVVEQLDGIWIRKGKKQRSNRDSNDKEIYPFAETIAKILNHTSDGTSRNFILTGAPSAGKTTELNVIAGELIKQWSEDSRKIIHFCSIQNTSISHAKINSKQELWNLIMESHSSKYWARNDLTISEFLKWHSINDLQPVLFVDTIDLLTYGSNQFGSDGEGGIAQYWNSIMDELDAEEFMKPTIIWSSRTVEWGILQSQIRNPNSVKEIKLQPISPDELRSKGLVERVAEEKKAEQNLYFLRHIQQSFPILAGYAIQKLLHGNTIEELNKMLNKVIAEEDIHPAKKQSPIPWIMAAVNREFATDVLYRCLVSSLCEKVERRFDKKRYSQEYIKSIWEGFVEIEFYEAALPRFNVGRRIQVQFDLTDFEEPHVKDIVNELLFLAIRTGILKKSANDVYEMGHQLFAEYCVYKIGTNNDNINDADTQNTLRGFPSIWLRLFDQQDSQVLEDDEDLKERLLEAKNWLYPFAVFNRALPMFQDETNLPDEWMNLIEMATYYSQTRKHDEIPDYDVDSFHWLNEEKTNLLNDNRFSEKPLLINGPPGVGKSHISFIWADQRAFKNAGAKWIPVQDGEGGKNDFIRKDVRDKNPVKAMFMTLNRNLIEQQNKRIKQYYQGSINPLNWQTVDIETYLQDMCKIIGIKWKKLEYSKFEEAFHENLIKQRNNSLLNEVRKKSIPALWLEYQVNFIDPDGVKKETDSYRGGRSDLFTTDEKDHMEAFAKYCQSEFTKYLSIPEIAGVISNRILEIENSDSRRDKERILTMKSDILVLDEVQDLTSPMLSLLLLMHKGELGSIFMCGDDEQTLLFSPFDWKNTFQKINAFFHKKSQIYPSSWQLKRLLAPKWKSAASDDLNNLLVVERNVEPIVDFIADSWNTSISQLVRPDSEPTTGAGAVKAGKKAKNKGEVLDKTGQMYGVYQRKIDSTSLIQLCKDISGSTQDAAVVFPDEILRDYFYVELAKEGIDLPLYTTSDVKGLEYPMVLPISPWSMNLEKINSHLPSSMNTLSEIEDYMQKSDSNINRKEIIKNIAKQRKRFANIIISRAENLLVVLNLDDESLSKEHKILDFKTPESFPQKEKMEINFSAWTDDLDTRMDSQKQESGPKTIKLKSADSLIYRLCTMIDSANQQGNMKQISMQARHIVNALTQQLGAEEKFSQSEIKNYTLPFVLIGILGRRNLTKSQVKYLLTMIHEHWGEGNSIQTWIKDKQKEVHISKNEYLEIPFGVYDTFQRELFNRISQLFLPGKQCFSVENLEEISPAQRTIQWFLQDIFLENLSDKEDGVKEWILTFEKLNLQDFTVSLPLSDDDAELRVMNPDFSSFDLLIDKERKKEKRSAKEFSVNSEGRSRFWKKGIELLEEPIMDYDSKEKTGFNHEERRDFLKQMIRESKALPNSNKSFLKFFHKLSMNVLEFTIDSLQDKKAESGEEDAVEELNGDIKTILQGYLKFDGLGDNKSLALKRKSYEVIAKVLLSNPSLFHDVVSRNPLDLFHKIDHAKTFEAPFILQSQLTMYNLVNILEFEHSQKRLIVGNKLDSDNFLAKYVLDLISKIVSKGVSEKGDFTVETYFSNQIFKDDLTTGTTSKNLFDARGFPRSFADVFSNLTSQESNSKSPGVRKYVPLKEIIIDSMGLSQIQKIIFTFYRNIYENFHNKEIEYHYKTNERKKAMIANFEILKKELADLKLGKLKSNENIFTKEMVFKILNIPKFKSNVGDIMFQRTIEEDPAFTWLEAFGGDLGISRLLGSFKDDYSKYDLKEEVLSKMQNIKLNCYHFDRIHALKGLNTEVVKKLRKDHILGNISNNDWRKMTVKESVNGNKGWGISSMDISSFKYGEFNLQSLVMLYSSLNEIRGNWLEGITKFQQNPRKILTKSDHLSSHISDNFGETQSDWHSPELKRLADKFDDENKKEQLIESLKLVVNKMTEPRYFLSMILQNFTTLTSNTKTATGWSTLSNHFFSEASANPKWFSSLPSDIKKGVHYYTFQKCVLEQCSKKYIGKERDFLQVELIKSMNQGRNPTLESKVITLLQSFGATDIGFGFAPSNADMKSVQVNLNDSAKSIEKAQKLFDEVNSLPDLNLIVRIRE